MKKRLITYSLSPFGEINLKSNSLNGEIINNDID